MSQLTREGGDEAVPKSSMDGGSIALCFAVFIVLGVLIVHHGI